MKVLQFLFLILFPIILLTSNTVGQDTQTPMDFFNDAPKTKVMLLGVFHFNNAGLDDYKPDHQMDIHSLARQDEIREIVNKLEKFRPTKIGLEFKHTAQARMDSLYSLYREGKFELPANEIFQLGFRLADQSGLNHLYGVDATGKSYLSISELTQEEYDEKATEYMRVGLIAKPNTTIWYPHYQELYMVEDSLKMIMSLEEHFLHINQPDRIEIGHGHYLVDSFKFGIGRDGDYFGADMKTRWYNRNLRILQNIYRMIDSTEDRVLIIIGSGHLPILRHAIISSPEMELVEIMEYLN